jgi:hypothetical protein
VAHRELQITGDLIAAILADKMLQDQQDSVPEILGQNPALINAGSDRADESVDRLDGRVRKVFQLAHGTASRRNSIGTDVFDAVEVSARDIRLKQRDAVIVLGGKGVRFFEHLFLSLLLIDVMTGNRVRPPMKGRAV